MLEKAEGEKCHATNFLKAFSSIPDGMSCTHNEPVLLSVLVAKKLQITEETSPQNTLEVRIQSANRFILNQVVFDYRGVALDDSKLYQVLTSSLQPSLSLTLGQDHRHQRFYQYEMLILSS